MTAAMLPVCRQLAETIGTRFACMNEEHELKML